MQVRQITKISVILTMLLSNFACKKEHEIVSEKSRLLTTINIDVEKEYEKYFSIDTLVSDIEYIPLETTKESLVEEISKIEVTDSLIFILDNSDNEVLLIFGRNGKFIRKIDRKGRGAEEYRNLVDFSYNTKDKSLLICDYSQVLKYDVEGRFQKRYKQNSAYGYIANLGNDVMITHNGLDYASFTKHGPCDYQLVSNNRVERSFFEIDQRLWENRLSSGMYTSSQKVLINPNFSNDIYEYSDSLVHKYHVNFVDRNFSLDLLPEKVDNFNHIDLNKDLIIGKRLCIGIDDLVESSDYLFFSFISEEGVFSSQSLCHESIGFLYSKKRENQMVFRGICSSIGVSEPIGCFRNYFVSTIDPCNYINGRIDDPKFKKAVRKSSAGDNPILVFYRLK